MEAAGAPFILRVAGKMVGIIAPIGFDDHNEGEEDDGWARPRRRRIYAEDLSRMLSSAGSWDGRVDTDRLSEGIYRARAAGVRDRVESSIGSRTRSTAIG